MNNPLQLLFRAGLVLVALTMTTGCLPSPYDYSGNSPDYEGRTGVPTNNVRRTASTGMFFGSGFSSYGGGYGSRSTCSRCGYNPCRCSNRSSSGHSDHGYSGFSSRSTSSSRSSSSGHDDHKAEHPHDHDTYTVASGSGLRSSQTKPSGYHSADWYKSRGYDTKKLDLRNEHGEKKGSGGSKSSSSSSKKKKK